MMYFLGKPLIRLVWRIDNNNGDYVAELVLDKESKNIRIPVYDMLEFSVTNPQVSFDDLVLYYLYENTSLGFREEYLQ